MSAKSREAVHADQRDAIEHDRGRVYGGAGPGTGQTTLLVERYRTLRARGISATAILLLTFSRRAVLDLRERLAAAGFPSPEAEVRTFHGFAARVIGGGAPTFRDGRLLDGFSRAIVLDTAIANTATPALGPVTRASRTLRADLERLLGDLARIAPASLVAIEADASPRLRDALRVRAKVVRAHAAIGGSDLGDLVARGLGEGRRTN
ncbi:MAG: hypothetical protein NVS3B17_12010 [Vulcanimicrobiaceae bacterium]